MPLKEKGVKSQKINRNFFGAIHVLFIGPTCSLTTITLKSFVTQHMNTLYSFLKMYVCCTESLKTKETKE